MLRIEYRTLASSPLQIQDIDDAQIHYDFHCRISDYIRNSVTVEIPNVLLKYLY